jgi:hypothetical protein
MADYYTLLTNAGIAYETACKAAGVAIKLAQISVGDGNGAVYNPDASAKALKREVWRGPLSALFQDEKNANWLLAEVTIPSNVGGWYVREAGLWTDSGILYAIVKYPESYKPVLTTSGAGKEFYIRSIFETTNAANVTLLIDDTVVKATRAWVVDYLAQQLAKGTYTKLEIEALIAKASALPVGAMVPFPLGIVPSGYLEVDNSLFKDSVYPDLAGYLAKKFNVAGDAVGFTRLPESRGEFFRGWDHGRGVDAGRAIPSFQADAFKSHTHTPLNQTGINSEITPGGAKALGGTTFDVLKDVGFTGGSETRPRNLAVMWCIKAWNAPVNQGSIDVAALVPLAAQATETNQGTVKVATQAQLNAGVDDAAVATPKKLRAGFSISLGMPGYIAFPTWLGGLIIQWFKGPVSGLESVAYPAVSFPLAFPNACLIPSVSTMGNDTVFSDQVYQVSSWSKETIKLFPQWFGTGNQGLNFPLVIAIGY